MTKNNLHGTSLAECKTDYAAKTILQFLMNSEFYSQGRNTVEDDSELWSVEDDPYDPPLATWVPHNCMLIARSMESYTLTLVYLVFPKRSTQVAVTVTLPLETISKNVVAQVVARLDEAVMSGEVSYDSPECLVGDSTYRMRMGVLPQHYGLVAPGYLDRTTQFVLELTTTICSYLAGSVVETAVAISYVSGTLRLGVATSDTSVRVVVSLATVVDITSLQLLVSMQKHLMEFSVCRTVPLVSSTSDYFYEITAGDIESVLMSPEVLPRATHCSIATPSSLNKTSVNVVLGNSDGIAMSTSCVQTVTR